MNGSSKIGLSHDHVSRRLNHPLPQPSRSPTLHNLCYRSLAKHTPVVSANKGRVELYTALAVGSGSRPQTECRVRSTAHHITGHAQAHELALSRHVTKDERYTNQYIADLRLEYSTASSGCA